MIEIPREVLDFLTREHSFVLAGHEEPDGDCIASQLVLASYLRRRGSTVHLCSDGPFNRPEIAEYAPQFETELEAAVLDTKPAVVVLDCATAERTGTFARSLNGLRTLVIDHHSSGSSFGGLRFIEPTAPATALLVQLIIEADGGELKPAEAQLLLFGMCTDTGFFRHLDAGAQQTFAATGRLVAAGGDPSATYERIYGNRSFERRKLLGKQLERAVWLSDRILYTYQTVADLRELEEPARGDDDLYALLRSVAGADVVAFAREEKNGECSVSLRSSSDIDVGVVALGLGGGGHRQAAGFTWPGSLETARTELRQRLQAAISLTGPAA